MKFSVTFTGLCAVLTLAAPFSAEQGITRRDYGQSLQLKRNTEAAVAAAAAAYKQFERALTERSLQKKATPSTDSTDQDIYNGRQCLKFKREAESAAEAAAEAYAKYESALAADGFVEI